MRATEPTEEGSPAVTTFGVYVNGDHSKRPTYAKGVPPGPLNGDFQVTFSGDIDAPVKKGETLTVEFLSWTSSSSAHPTLQLLCGSSNFASMIKIKGLNETVPK